ncbi:MAG: cysteine desulfurase family protein [Acholeplasmataceae bacterium]
MKTIYLDHAATTPVRDEVREAMTPYLSDSFGNPSSLHHVGIPIRKLINDARQTILNGLNAPGGRVIFTSGGTEASNIAIKGYAFAHPKKKRIITSKVEHHATLHACAFMASIGYEVIELDVDQQGFIDPADLEAHLNDDTLLVSIIWGNNEVGTIQDIAAIGKRCKKKSVPLHVDAVQVFGHKRIDLAQLDIDMLTLSAHKFYGPKGSGCLFLRDGIEIEPLIHGGRQEMNLRAGTENVAGILGMARAFELMLADWESYSDRLVEKAARLKELVFKLVGDVRLNGPLVAKDRLSGNLNLAFRGVSGMELAYELDQRGIAVSTGSACNARSIEPSHVLKAMGIEKDYLSGAIRLSLGRTTTDEDIDFVAKAIAEAVDELRE